jgi:hypothetical protein
MSQDNMVEGGGALLGRSSRRGLIERAGLGAVAVGAMAAGAGRLSPAQAQTADIDVGILNFALNLEYLEGEFYSFAAYGHGLGAIASKNGTPGGIKGGAKVPALVPQVAQLMNEIATDEGNHVAFLVGALGSSGVAEPAIDFTDTFAALGAAIGLPGFNPFHDQLSFLLGAYIFEDVGVTAYNGAAPLVTNKTYLGAAASILAVEAYHASTIRTLLYQFGGGVYTDRIAAVRAAASGTGPGTNLPADDQGVLGTNNVVNIVPTDSNSLAFTRTPQQVLKIVFNGGTTSGGFFPKGVGGMFNSSAS